MVWRYFEADAAASGYKDHPADDVAVLQIHECRICFFELSARQMLLAVVAVRPGGADANHSHYCCPCSSNHSRAMCSTSDICSGGNSFAANSVANILSNRFLAFFTCAAARENQ